MKNYEGKNVLILGAARQGTALARFLSKREANVVLNDNKPAASFDESIHELETAGIKTVLGEHPFSLLDECDQVYVSGGVPLTIPILVEAQKRNIPLSNDSQVFFDEVQANVIGITGSAGKTTTTTLVGEITRQACKGKQRAWVGGNIGTPLITVVDEIQPDDFVVVELSSFQLELMHSSPAIAAITNITPNHLDRHGTMQAYTKAKANILAFQNANDTAILNREDMGAWGLRKNVAGKLVSFGHAASPSDTDKTYFENEEIWLRSGANSTPICSRESIQLRGDHNIMNVLAACAITHAVGIDTTAMRAGIERVKGIPHRLEFVRKWHGADWYNDSIATAPERTMAAVQAFSAPLVLLLGGRDKKLPWDALAKAVHSKAEHIILFGEAANLIESALHTYEKGSLPYSLDKYERIEDAIQAAAEIVEEGDVVLLSPGGTSYDAFVDFEERGELFKQIVESFA